jgi:hypothetical protein
MSTSHRRLVMVLLVVGVGALAWGFGPPGAGSRPVPDEHPAPGDQASIRGPALGGSEPAMLRDSGTAGDRVSRVLRPAVATGVLVALVSALVALWPATAARRLRLRTVAVVRTAPRGPPLRLA